MRLYLWALALAGCLIAAAIAAEQPPGLPANSDGVVLLRNGQVLHGKITRSGNHVVVSLPSGEIRLKADTVEYVCRDLEEGYQKKHEQAAQGNVPQRLDLAQWCIRHELFGYAARELSEVIATDPTHPRIALVERQLTLARERPVKAAGLDSAGDAPPSNDDLDRMTRGMPPGTIETFSNTVQPLLLNTCTAAGCHGPQSETALRLLRIPLGKTASRRLTQRNLHAVLATIDRDKPSASRLLTAPIAPHGTAKSAIFTNREVAQYRHLVDWVDRVAHGTTPQQPASVERPSESLAQTMPSAVPPAALSGPGSAVPPQQDANTVKVTAEAPKPDEPTPPVDEFDPEIFNRQFGPK